MARLVRDPNGLGAGVAYPTYASDSSSAFIPQIWSALMIEKFYPNTVFGEVANTDYQGEIKSFGDSVVIRTTPDITVVPYQVGMDLTYEVPESPSTLLEINKGWSFSFSIEGIDRYQSDIDLMSDWAQDAANQMAIKVDTDILANVPDGAAARNQGLTAGAISNNIDLGVAGDPVGLTAANVLDWIVDLGTTLDEQNVPETDRCLILPARIVGLIKKSDLRDASIAGDGQSIVRNGRVGMVDRFTLFLSNLMQQVNPGEYEIMAIHKSALTFAAQMDEEKLVHMLNPSKHGELIRGLMVYGYKVLKPESLVKSVASVA